ncbi:MAG: AAA family ATPase, partial [Clostridiales bacterium]|nr:AAA family ATPase [Clostridiales bacterium]
MIMTESKEELILWRKKILKALGRSGAIITELIPEVEFLIGPQPAIETLNPKEAQNRFLMAFSNFLKIFAEKEHPLVLFLDDLQWADLSSLKLINHLCSDTGLNYVLLVGAYRSNEVNEEHPLSTTIKEIADEGICVENIVLSSFNKKETVEFIKGALCCSKENASLISDRLYSETYGIPLFLGQLLISLYENNILIFSAENSCWQLKEESIQGIQIPDGIAELMLEKMKNLNKGTRDVLMLASCIGSGFDLDTISTVCEKTQIEVENLLLPAVMEGFIYQPSSYNNNGTERYEFFHDVVRQAAYSLLSPEEKKRIHVKVGRLILQNTRQEEIENKLLPILEHINRGLDLIEDPEERLKLAEYNLVSGRKAKASAAYDSAKNCFSAGIELLPHDSWNSHYLLTYNLYLELVQCEYLIGDVSKTEELFEVIIRNTKTEIERADVYSLKMILYAGGGKYDEAVEIGISTLGNFGINIPKNPGLYSNAKELLLYKWYMRNKTIKDLINLPEMKDPVQKKIAQLYISLILSACTSHPDLYSYCIIKIGNHGLKYGNTEMTSIGFIGYAITEGSVLGNYSAGYELGEVAIEHAERFGKSYTKCVVYFTMGALIQHWLRHGKEGIQYLQNAIKYALEAGDVLIAGYSYSVILENKFIIGTILDEVKRQAQICKSYARRMKHENLGANTFVYERHIRNLANPELDAASVGIDDSDEQHIIKLSKGDN